MPIVLSLLTTGCSCIGIILEGYITVDTRAWFLNELDVDILTPKIMGDASLADLVKTAVENMPQPSEETVWEALSSQWERRRLPGSHLSREKSCFDLVQRGHQPPPRLFRRGARFHSSINLGDRLGAAHLRRGVSSRTLPPDRRDQWSSMGWTRKLRK